MFSPELASTDQPNVQAPQVLVPEVVWALALVRAQTVLVVAVQASA
jgi:hypothetical protein